MYILYLTFYLPLLFIMTTIDIILRDCILIIIDQFHQLEQMIIITNYKSFVVIHIFTMNGIFINSYL